MGNSWQAQQYIIKLDAFLVDRFPASYLPGFNMSPPSIATSISRILNTATKLVGSFQYMRDQSSEHNQIYLEIVVLQNLLTRAYSKAEDSKVSAYWFSSVQFLTRKDGVFDQTIEVLESLARNVIIGGRAWPFGPEETKRIWERIRGTNKLIDFALDSVVSRFSTYPLLTQMLISPAD
jgi:hypothetical protein